MQIETESFIQSNRDFKEIVKEKILLIHIHPLSCGAMTMSRV